MVNNNIEQKKNIKNYSHGFHLVNSSPWPFYTAHSIAAFLVGFVLYFHHYRMGICMFSCSFYILCWMVGNWFYDIIVEATYEGNHTTMVQRNIKYGMLLFIVSEVMFFFSFFWAFFHSSLSPTIDIGVVWPPLGIETFKYYQIPLLNTLILLTSGASITWAHKGFFLPLTHVEYFPILGHGYFKNTKGYHSLGRITVFLGLVFTIFLGFIFTCIQIYEYRTAPFSIQDSVYGSVFYMATGFHGLHVLIGTIFLVITLIRHYFYHFTKTHHVGFETAAWYWHFVDVVWLFLYICVYCWGS